MKTESAKPKNTKKDQDKQKGKGKEKEDKKDKKEKKEKKEQESDSEDYYTEEEIKLLDQFHEYTKNLFIDDEIYDVMVKFNNDEALIKNELDEMLKEINRGDEFNWTEIGKSN